MKKTLLLIVSAVLLFYNANAQTIPYGFNSGKTYPIKLPGVEDAREQLIAQTLDSAAKKALKASGLDSNYNTLAGKLEAQAKKIEAQANADYNTGFAALPTPVDQNGIDNLNSNLKALNQKRENSYATVKALRKAALGYRYLARTSNNFNAFFVKNSVDAEMYYNGTLSDSKAKFLNNSLLSFSTDGGQATLYNELYADYFGPIRVGFGALVSSKQTPSTATADDIAKETQQDATQRLLGGGGNGVFNLSYPIISAQSNNAFFFKFIAAPKFGVDIPKIGTDNNSYATNYNLGVEGSLFYSGADNILTFFTNFRFANVAGNGLFYDNLSKADHKAFGFDQVSVGLAISNVFRLSINKYFGSSFVTSNFPTTISFTVIPN